MMMVTFCMKTKFFTFMGELYIKVDKRQPESVTLSPYNSQGKINPPGLSLACCISHLHLSMGVNIIGRLVIDLESFEARPKT